MNNSTKFLLAAWVNNFLGNAGIISSWEPDDFEPDLLRWLDKRESINDLQIALKALRAALRSDWQAREGYLLAGQILEEIKDVLRDEPRRILFRRPNRKAQTEQAYA